MTARGWEFSETIGIGIPNPRSYVRIPIPPDLTPEQLAELEAWIDKTNADADAKFKAEQAEVNKLP